jgi:hypothetical protein
MLGVRRFVGVSVCAVVGLAAPVRADVVTDWNLIAQNTMAAAGPVQPARMIDFAMLHIAIHDAVQAVQGRFETYSKDIAATSGSEIAAAAKAARDVLVNRFPAQTAATDASYQAYLTAHQIQANDPGIAAGAQAAAACIQGRTGDGSYPVPPPTFFGGTGIGEWRPTVFTNTTPPEPTSMVTPWLGTMRTFAVLHSSQMFSGAPPRITSRRYTRDYNEVKDLGGVVSKRTPEQSAVAVFFSDNQPFLWNRTMRGLTDRYLKDVGDSARMFALVNIAMTDAVMTSWQMKTHYNFWRPVTAIQMGELDGNRATAGDPSWQPFFATPNYPDYTSGANSLSGAATEVLRLFFGTDRVPFTLMGTSASRDYLAFSDAADDVVDGRVWMGIHFRFADEASRDSGMRVARYTFKYFLRANDGDNDLNFLADVDDPIESPGADWQDDEDAERP